MCLEGTCGPARAARSRSTSPATMLSSRHARRAATPAAAGAGPVTSSSVGTPQVLGDDVGAAAHARKVCSATPRSRLRCRRPSCRRPYQHPLAIEARSGVAVVVDVHLLAEERLGAGVWRLRPRGSQCGRWPRAPRRSAGLARPRSSSTVTSHSPLRPIRRSVDLGTEVDLSRKPKFDVVVEVARRSESGSGSRDSPRASGSCVCHRRREVLMCSER